MTLTLSLLRHAKSSWTDPAQGDFDRPLAERGRAAAPLMGQHMRAIGVLPELVLCSPARRTRETLALVIEAARLAPAVRFEDRLYLATSETIVESLKRLSGPLDAANPSRPVPPTHVMIVGHNPGLHELAVELVRLGPAPMRRDLIRKFPTAALAVISLEADSWADVAPGSGTLKSFTVPRRLMGE